MIVLVPAYEPDERLVALVRELRKVTEVEGIVVVDDGSGPDYAAIFDEVRGLAADVLTSEVNRGKGAALKRGFAHVMETRPGSVVVCADCDGQHLPADILAVADAAADSPRALVLGVRRFTGRVPFKSRFGNSLTRWLFSVSTGRRVSDTQTGLRAYHPALLEWLTGVPGERFEYELEILLRSRDAGLDVTEVPIETVYIDGNESTHFRPVVDSLRVYAPLARFCASSISAFVVDVVVLQIVYSTTGSLAAAVVGARTASSIVNFAANRRFVFGGSNSSRGISAAQYFSLVVAILFANYWSMHLLYISLGVPLLVAKVITELTLFTVSYQVQKRFIFRIGRDPRPAAPRVGFRTGGRRTAAVLVIAVGALALPSIRDAATASATPVVEYVKTYSDESVSIEVSKVAEGTGASKITYFVANLELTDATRLRSGLATDLGRTRATPTQMAQSAGAVFAVSGDYFGFRNTGLVVRNGTVIVDKGVRTALVLQRDGSMTVQEERSVTARRLVARGAWQTASFGPALLEGGKISPRIRQTTDYIKQRHPRAGVCMRSPGSITFIVVDGRRSGYSRGVNLREFARLFRSRGCTVAYNLDGGRTATMYFDGRVINRPPGGQRSISDIFYVATPPT